MPTVYLAPDPINSTQLIPGGVVLASGGKLFQYLAGSSTKTDTYTDITGTVKWSNPIVLDSGGNLGGSNEVWIPAGVTVKFVLAPFNDTDPPIAPYKTWDNLSGINDPTSLLTEWVVGPTPTFVSTTSFTLVGDQTAIFTPGRRVKTTNTAGTRYGTISTSVFGAVTTVTITNDSGVLDAGLSAVWYALINPKNTSLPLIVSVLNFGAKGDGVTDDTAAIVAAYAYAEAQAFAGISPSSVPIIKAVIDVPAGDYVFNGPALNFSTNSAVYFRGAGRQQTRIKIAAGIYFVNTDKLIYSTHVSGIHFTGGKGAFRYSGTATNVQGTHVFEDCYFGNYTECAIGNDATDMPYWKIHRNIFLGTITSKGVSLNGLTDASTIEDNSFQYNLIHCQIGTNGTMAMVRNNEFIRGFASVGTPIIDIWLVPGSQTIGLVGTQILNNRMGNENLDVTDYRILIADEDTGTGTDHITYKPKLSASTQFASALKIKDNRVGGIPSARELITSWTVQLSGLEVRNDFYGTPIATLRFGAGVNVPSGTQDALLNLFEASQVAGGAADELLPEPVVPFSGVFDDPNALYQGYSSVHSYHHSGYDSSFLDLTTTDISAFTVGTGSGANVADATGANLAVEYTATGSGFNAFGTFTAATANRIAYIEFDLKQGSSLTLPTLDFRITNNANLGDVAVRRLISIPTYWKRIRIPFSLPSLGATYNLAAFQIVGYSAGVATKFQVARVRIYHAHEPVNLVTMGGTLNTNPPATETNATRTVLFTDSHIIANRAGTVTLTLPSALLNPGREITVRTIQAQTVVSASSNVVPLVGGAAGTAILAATAGKWALLKSDGTNWQIMEGN